MELNRIGVNINQIARAFNARVKGMGMLEEIKDGAGQEGVREPTGIHRRIVGRGQRAFEPICMAESREVMSDVDDVCAGIARRAGTHVLHRVRRGKRRRDHLQNGTDRIAAQMGDMPSRGEFIAYCNGLHAVHPNMVNEGYELRVSWALDELNPGNPDDVQRGMEHAYLLCHELAPDSPCWVTMHVDGEGGCVHAHATIANHDCRTGQVINKDDTSLFAPRVQAVNDELSREWGLSVIGADKDKSTWAEKRDSFEHDSFDRHLGDAVAKARDDASDIDDFKQRLAFAGVTLNETSKVDKKTGEKSVGWSYRMRDEWGPKRRTRKRRASNLADDLTKEGVERFFEEKQGQQTCEALETSPVRSRIPRWSAWRIRSRIPLSSMIPTCTNRASPT